MNRILIVEDDARLREVLCDYFKSKGDMPFEAANGVEALELAEETARELAGKYPEGPRPREAIAASKAWASGEIKMPIAKQAILNCHAMVKELADPADIARCHAVGQACSVVHTTGHALGYPMYALTAIVLEHGLEECREPIEQRVMYYEQRLRCWMEYEKTCQLNWAGFLKK